MFQNKIIFCAITGASKGIGRAVAIELAKKLHAGSSILLISRSADRLCQVKAELESQNTNLIVSTAVCDLSKCDITHYDKIINDAKSLVKDKIDVALLVQNAASLGPMDKKASSLNDAQEIRSYMDENFTSFILFNSKFLEIFSHHDDTRIVVNVSSGAAYSFHPCFHLYGAAKASRDQFYRTLSVEEPDVRVLNFNPGPTVTDMQYEVEKQSWSDHLKKWSRDGTNENSGTFYKPEQVGGKLVEILELNNFESGSWHGVDGKIFPEKMLLEVCVDSLQSALNADAGGANRIELCSALSLGGLTPTAGLLKSVRKHLLVMPIYCMLRPRQGDFVYSDTEMEVILSDLSVLKQFQPSGFVFGALKNDGTVNIDQCGQVVDAAKPFPVTFHRAFDVCSNWQLSLDCITNVGFERILTSGQAPTASEGVEALLKIVIQTAGVELYTKSFVVSHQKTDSVELLLIDSSGYPMYEDFVKQCWPMNCLACLVYDMTNIQSFDKISNWLDKIQPHITKNNVMGLLIANKCDLSSRRFVTESAGKELAEKQKLLYFECSAKDNTNIHDAFKTLGTEWYKTPKL